MTLDPRVPGFRTGMRGNFSAYLLAASGRSIRDAREVEDRHDATGSGFDIEHRGYVLSAILCAVSFFDAMINELFQDAFDEYAPEGGAIESLSAQTRDLMAGYWGAFGGRRSKALNKYQMVLECAQVPLLVEGENPYQDAELAVRVRNTVAHYLSEDVWSDEPTDWERLRGKKFPDNPLMAGLGNSWWPDHCLGVGCASWVLTSVVAPSDHVTDAIGARPNYAVLRATGLLGDVPGAPAG